MAFGIATILGGLVGVGALIFITYQILKGNASSSDKGKAIAVIWIGFVVILLFTLAVENCYIPMLGC